MRERHAKTDPIPPVVIASVELLNEFLEKISDSDSGILEPISLKEGVYPFIDLAFPGIIQSLKGTGYELVLTAGNDAVKTIRVERDALHAFQDTPGDAVNSGEELVLSEFYYTTDEKESTRNVTLFGQDAQAIPPEGIIDALINGATLEISTSEQRALKKERAREIEGIRTELGFVVRELKAWYESRNSDSVSHQSQRKRVYSEICTALEDLVPRCKAIAHQMVLTAGDQEIEMVSFSKGAYDFISTHSSRRVPAHESLPLIVVSDLSDHINRLRTVYVGEYGRKVEVAILAEALSSGAEISLVPIES